MSANWDQTNQRQRLLAAALDDVATSGDPGAIHRHPIDEAFGDVDSFLLAVHARWATAVLARADLVLEMDPVDPETAMAEQLHELDAASAGTRVLLDAHTTHPPVAAARAELRGRILADLGVDLDDLPAPARPQRRHTCLGSRVLFFGRRLRLSQAS